jgi:hypothetical protein
MPSLIEKMHQAHARLFEGCSDPWRNMLQRGVPTNVNSISSVALLDLLDVPHTTGNAGVKRRRCAPWGR